MSAGVLSQPVCLYEARMCSSSVDHQSAALRCITKEELSLHCHDASCWITLNDKVYDVTEFLREHPGGEDIILEHAGRDATVSFRDVGHSLDAEHMIEQYCIGQLTKADRLPTRSPGSNSTVQE